MKNDENFDGDPRWAWVAPSLLALLPYAPWLRGDFLWDDKFYIYDEPRMVDPHGAVALLTQPLAGQVYRPLSTITWWLQIQLFGRSLVALRAGNLCLHALAASVLYACARSLGLSWRVAFVVATAFAVHTGCVEAVMFVNARHDALGTVFALLALLAWSRARTLPTTALGCLAVGLALLCKESFVVLMPLLVWARWITAPDGLSRGERARDAAAPALVGALGLAAVLALRRGFGIHSGTSLTTVSLAQTLTSMFGVFAHYARLAALFTQGPTAQAWAPTSPAAAALTALAMALAAVGLWRGRAIAGAGSAAFGFGWFFTLVAPVVVALPTTMQWANRYLYPALPGGLLGLAGLCTMVLSRAPQTGRSIPAYARWAVLSALVLAAGARTSLRASTWRTAFTLFGADVDDAPNDPRVLYHYGVALAHERGCEAALPVFQRSAQIDPTFVRAWHNVAGCLLNLNRPAEALEPSWRAFRLDRTSLSNRQNLAVALVLTGDPRGQRLLRSVCAARPGESVCQTLLRPP